MEDKARSQPGPVVPLRPPGLSPAAAVGSEAQFEDVRRAIERQSYKAALEKAKDLHKRLASAESRALLVDAYIARIQGMLAKDLTAEAKALADLVVSRFPEAAGRLGGLQRGLAAQTGDVAALAAPLADPNATPQQRAEAEQAVRQELVDLQALATSPALPEDHPLRVAAGELARAFAAVTTGEVDEAAIELAGVSRRSPLAPWKALIRAIASLYRGQDENCRRLLATLGDDAVPARVAGVLHSILNESWDESLTPAGRRLAEKIVGQRLELRTTLRALDEAFSRKDTREIPRQIRQAVQLCRATCPEKLERLKQHISVKCVVIDYPPASVRSAMGGLATRDAYFYRLFARALESRQAFLEACEMWDRFRNAAIEERLFAADGPENAYLYLHMAELLRHMPPEHLEEAREDFRDYLDDLEEWEDFDEDELGPSGLPRRGTRTKRNLYFLAPEQLYERAVALRPDAEIYRQWLEYVESVDHADLKPDPVAQQWAAEFPEDSRPLLHLAESAEQRDAFDKALKYIEQAERLGGVDPKVKRARFRLLVAKAVRHLKQKKPDLAAKDFVQIEQLPDAAQKDRPAFVLSLKWIHAILQGDRALATRLHEQVRDLLGGPVVAAILLLSTAREGAHNSTETEQLQKWLTAYTEKDIVGATVRVCQIAKDVNIETLLPGKWGTLLAKWFKRSDGDLDSAGLLTMAEAALPANWPEVAYYCCGYGLQKGGPLQARLLFLRGKSLPYSEEKRRQDCYAAALELARRLRDMDLVAEIMDASRRTFGPFGGFGPFGPGMMDLDDLAIDEETLKKVTDFERRTQEYPKGSGLPFFGGGGPPKLCQCPSCRRARGELPPPRPRRKTRRDADERYLFDDIYEEEEEFEEEIPDLSSAVRPPVTGLPPELAGLLEEIVRLSGGRAPKSLRELEQLVGRHPELRRKLEEAMLNDMSEDELDALDEFEDEPPGPFWPPTRRRGRKKKKRRR
ncbi:MAG: hypothetical protein FJ280_10995 [Planctomycetes bacterium]|nr:hypothetical protein [Planctomycetota bacterium]